MTGAGLFWLGPLLPLVAFGVLTSWPGLRGRWLPASLACVAVAGSLVLSVLGLLGVVLAQTRREWAVPFLETGGYRLQWAVELGPRTAVLAVLVSAVCLLVFVYTAFQLAEEPRLRRFYALLSLFAASMLGLVVAADMVTLFIAWELVGVCSYLLIGFWHEHEGAPAASSSAFLVTRLGDLALLAGVLLLVLEAGTGRLQSLLALIEDGSMPRRPLVASAVLMGVGALTKSAQVPFQGWLPSAMVAPTPVSALLHSATMVAAGVVLVVRLMPAFRASGVLPAFAWVGVATALLGGAAALVEENLKRALAYSTMSQLGFMFVALGADSLVAGMLLLVCHAFYKSLLFMDAGALKRAVGGEELSRMRGVGQHMRWTFAAFALGALALSGLPATVALPPKDPALATALQHGQVLFSLALLASLLTALYSARLATQLRARPLGEERAPEPHEVNRGILASVLVGAALVPVVLLVDARWLGSPLGTLLEGHTPHSRLALGLSLGVAALGVLAGVWATLRWPAAHGWPWLRPAVRPLEAELGLKPLYRAVAQGCVRLVKAVEHFDRAAFVHPMESFARGVLRAVRGVGRFEVRGPEALPERSARTMVRVVRASARFDVRALDRAARALGGGLVRISGTLLPVQTGRVDNYLLIAFAGTAAVVGLAVLVALLT